MARTPAPRLGDLFGQLVLPRLFRAGPAALRPERLLVAGIAVILVGSVMVAIPPVLGAPALLSFLGSSAEITAAELARGAAGPGGLADGLRAVFIDTPGALLAEAPLATLVLVVFLVAVGATAGLFLCRSAGMELGRGIHIKARHGLGFVRIKGPAAAAALVLPPVVVGLLLLTPLVVGLLLSAPGLDAVGALLYGLGMLVSLAASVVLFTWVFASPLIVPAVACDGADAFDAVQRAFAVVLSRPLTFALHAGVAVAQGLVLSLLVWLLLDLAAGLTAAAGGLVSGRAAGVIGAGGWSGPSMPAFTVSAITMWNRLPVILALAYAVSYAHTAATAVYLNMRLLVDGMEPNELWMPEDPAGVTSRPAARAAAETHQTRADPGEPSTADGADEPPADARESPRPLASHADQPA